MKRILLALLLTLFINVFGFSQTPFGPEQTIDGLLDKVELDAGSLVGGTGYVNSVNVPVTGGSGVGATVDIVAVAGIVTSVTINEDGLLYLAGDNLTITGGGGDATIDVLSVETKKTGDNPYVIASGDLDGDTYIDIVIGTLSGNTIEWYKNDGMGNFTIQTLVSSTLAEVNGIHIADIDPDDNANGNDILATSYSGDKLVWYSNDGAGGFGTEQVIAGTYDGAGQVTTADINNDGDLDIVLVVYGNDGDTDRVVWFAGDDNGNFGAEQTIDATIGSGPGSISIKDFDGDTDLDVLIGFTDGTNIEVYYNQYIESMTSTVSWLTPDSTVNSGNNYLFVSAFADYNDDGNLDIIKTDLSPGVSNPGVFWYNRETDGTYTPLEITNSIARPAVVMAANLNNDIYSDIIITNGGTNGDDIVWFESIGAGTYFPEAMISDAQNQVYGITVADFDGDGDNDIASVDYQNHELNWFENYKINPPLGLSDNEINKINIYPNPTSSKLYFKSSLTENFKVSVFDLLGKNIINTTIKNGNPLDVSKLHTGLYIIRFEDYNNTYKFVKE